MLKGSIGMRTIIGLLLGLLLLGVVVGSLTEGALGETIIQGLDSSSQYTDATTQIDVEDENAEETFSDLAMFVRDRAVNCGEVESRNEENAIDSGVNEPMFTIGEGAPNSDDPRELNGNYDIGYPGLASTNLGQKPSCIGGEASFVRRGWGNLPLVGSPQDNAMAGSLSRENFEITGDIAPDSGGLTFIDNRNTNDEYEDFNLNQYWLENNLLAASGRPVESHVSQSGEIGQQMEGTGRNYIVFFEENNVGEQRISGDTLLDDLEDYDDAVWSNTPIRSIQMEDDVKLNELRLCPGDKGHIQMNVELPYNTDLGSSEFDGSSSREYFPMIVIEETELDTCGSDLVDERADKIPIGVETRGRLLHITGFTADNDHPYVGNPTRSNTAAGDRYAFDFHNLNEEEDRVFLSTSHGTADVEFNFDENRADKCIVGLFDYTFGYPATGWVAIDEGTRIPLDGSFPSADSSSVDDYHLPNVEGSAGLDGGHAGILYGRHSDPSVDPNEDNAGFDSSYHDWLRTDVGDKILYDFGGERKYELYGDLLCAPHSDNDNFEHDHSEWNMCDSEETVEIDGTEWSCDPVDGSWTSDGGSSPSPPSGSGPTPY